MWNILKSIVNLFSGESPKLDQLDQEDRASDEIRLAASDNPIAFGYKCQWLAIRSTDNSAVADALKLTARKNVSWVEGIDKIYQFDVNAPAKNRAVFVTPPIINKWVLVASATALPSAQYPASLQLLESLSSTFGEAQYFGTHRIVDYHAWAKAKKGKVIRAFAYLGEQGLIYWKIGRKTAVEKDCGFNFQQFDSDKFETVSKKSKIVYPNEELVMKIAARWSVNPTEIEQYKIGSISAISGKLATTWHK